MTCSHRSWVPKARTPKDMGDGVGIPAFGEHGNRDDAADGFAEAAFFADGVHDFPQQILIGEVFGLTAVAGTFDDFTAETLDFVGGHLAEIVVQGIAGFKLFAVDQQRARPGKRIAVFVEVAEQGPDGRFPGWWNRLRSPAENRKYSRKPAWMWRCCCRQR